MILPSPLIKFLQPLSTLINPHQPLFALSLPFQLCSPSSLLDNAPQYTQVRFLRSTILRFNPDNIETSSRFVE